MRNANQIHTLTQSLQTALAHHQAGRRREAERIYRKVLAVDPANFDALLLLGDVSRQDGKNERAIEFITRAIKRDSLNPFAHNNLGDALQACGRLDEAVASYRQALALKPDYAEAYNNLGDALQACGRLNEAEGCLRKALELKPGYVEAHNNLGNVFKTRGRLGEAEVCYRKALMLQPDYAQAYSNLGNVLLERGHLEEAEVNYRKAMKLKPHFSEAHNNLGNVFKTQGRLGEAEACYRKALTLQPDYPQAYSNLGNVLLERGHLKEAEANYRKALKLKPHFSEAHSNLLLMMQYDPRFSSEELFAEAFRYGQQFEDTIKIEGDRQCGYVRDSQKKIKVGIVSGDLRNHPVGNFTESMLRYFDRKVFILYAYANQTAQDELTKRIRPYFGGWSDAKGLSDEELAMRIRADEIDILLDLSGHTAGNRLPVFACKPAPVQVTWLGYPNTTGMKEMDYILADPITVPVEEEKFYTEKVWRLPKTSLCFTPPEVDVDEGELPALKKGYVTFGCFNNLAKLNDKVIACWADILRAVPNSVMLLKYKPFNMESVREEYRQRFYGFGIGPERLQFEGFSPRNDRFASCRQIDLALDPFPFAGVTTTCEALWMGVPTLTMKTPRGMVGHNGELIMGLVGLSAWVAESVEEYIEKARTFAEDKKELIALRSGLRSRLLNSPLCDGAGFAKELEGAFQGMLQMRLQLSHSET